MCPAPGFWMERALRLQQQHQLLGPAVLVCGCRSQQSDYLMEATLNDMVAAGALSQVLVAFSRERGVPKTYVQVGGARIVEIFGWEFLNLIILCQQSRSSQLQASTLAASVRLTPQSLSSCLSMLA
jgi:hypothetical protein